MPRAKKTKKELELVWGAGHSYVKNRKEDPSRKITKGSVISPPSLITNENVKKQWEAVVGELTHMEIICIADLPSLEQAFIFLEEYHETLRSIKELRKTGDVIIDPDVNSHLYKLNLSLAKASTGYHQIMYRFGITPSERTKIINFEKSTEPADAIDAIIMGS